MRVLKSLLLFTTVNAEGTDANLTFDQLAIDSELPKRHSFNRLATLNKMMNRLTAYSKGHSPDDPDILDHTGVTRAFKGNNRFFSKTLVRMFYKEDSEGNLHCAVHEKQKKQKTERRRRDDQDAFSFAESVNSLAYSQANFDIWCDMMEDFKDTDKECEDCCAQDKDGNFVPTDCTQEEIDGGTCPFGKVKAFGLNLDGEDIDFSKNARKMFTAVKKWIEMYLGDCRQKKVRYVRIVNLLSKRLFNAVVAGVATMEDVEDGRWKRIFPHKDLNIMMDGADSIIDKYTLINLVKGKYEAYQSQQNSQN